MVELLAISSKTAKHSASGTMLAVIDVEEMKQLHNTMAHPGFHSGGFISTYMRRTHHVFQIINLSITLIDPFIHWFDKIIQNLSPKT